MMKKLFLLALVMLIAMTGLGQAELMTSGRVMTSGVTFASGIEFTHEFQFYDVISDQYVNVTDFDIMKANAHTFETGGVPLISSPISGKVYSLPDSFGASDDWIECLPLGGMVAAEPMGGGLELPAGSGNRFYSTGGLGPSGDGLSRYAYIALTGWDPEILWQRMGGA